MNKAVKTAIVPTRADDYPEWYQQVVRAADLAETSPVRGCMVIKPWGYALWEQIRGTLDRMFKDTGHVNAYFPLFIPLSFLEKEAAHVEGFAKECAVVTHHRLETGPDGKLVPTGELEEPLVVRPTSETIIGAMFAKWVQSYRDLPILINQWANVVRWEMRTRMFLRTTEFLWQEGHTVHETRAEAWEETLRMLDVYRTFAETHMAMPVLTGEKTAGERFPGADHTFCIEALMQDCKALQAGTTHFLGQNFAKASDIQFQSRTGARELAWTTSWGVSTRLIGAMIMTHGDDDGMIMPPRLAPSHVAILPIFRTPEDAARVLPYCDALAARLKTQAYEGRPIEVVVDRRDLNAGEKGWQWVKRGVPLRVEIGPRDLEQNAVMVARRDQPPRDKRSLPVDAFVAAVPGLLAEIQAGLYARALAFRENHTQRIADPDAFTAFFTPANAAKPEVHGGFALSPWCGQADCERAINDRLAVTIRCLPQTPLAEGSGPCMACGQTSSQWVVFAKAY